jgi:hypothetical protein
MSEDSMFDKLKGIGAQVATRATGAVGNLSGDKAVRASTAQLCTMLETAIAEMEGRPIAGHPVTLTASVNIGIAALEMQVHLPAPAPPAGAPPELPAPRRSRRA